MKTVAVMRRELVSYFWSPLGWIVMTLFALVQGYSFYLLMQLVSQPYAPHGAVLQLFFGGTLLYWLFLIVIVSLITMRLVAEERRSGTMESLLTAPVSELQIVLGKYLAATCFFSVLWLPTGVYVLLVWQLQGEPPLDWGPVASGYLGTLSVGAASLALGLLCSSITRNQLIAALLTFSLLAMGLLLEPLRQFVHGTIAARTIAHVSLFAQMEQFSRGIVDGRHLVYHASIVGFCLFGATKALERQR